MDSSVSRKDEIWFLRVCHHISAGVYLTSLQHSRTMNDRNVFGVQMRTHQLLVVTNFLYFRNVKSDDCDVQAKHAAFWITLIKGWVWTVCLTGIVIQQGWYTLTL